MCNKEITVYIPKGYDYVKRTVKCGSTSYTGGINRCPECIKSLGIAPEPYEDESDMEYHERTHNDNEDY